MLQISDKVFNLKLAKQSCISFRNNIFLKFQKERHEITYEYILVQDHSIFGHFDMSTLICPQVYSQNYMCRL